MKAQKFLIFLVSLMIIFSSCHKSDSLVVSNDSMANLKVPSNFGWSVSKNISINVTTIGISEGSLLILYDPDDNILNKQRVFNNQAKFENKIKTSTNNLRLYSPETKISKSFSTTESDITFEAGTYKGSLVVNDYALDFTKSNQDRIVIDNDTMGGIVIDYPFTFSVWFQTSGGGGTDMTLVSLADPNTTNHYFGISLDENRYPTVISNDGITENSFRSSSTVNGSSWHQITAVFDTADSRTLYVDGSQVATDVIMVDTSLSAVVLSFGCLGGSSPSEYYDGQMDNVCVWNKALTATEVAHYYINLPTGSEANLAGYWDFNEGSGSDIYNVSTLGGYDGTNSGAIYVGGASLDTDGDTVFDDEDDFPMDPDRAHLIESPAGDDYYFELYEDLWPSTGDYDFNDVILKVKEYTYTNATNNIVGGRIKAKVYWIGGSLPEGVGMEWFSNDGDDLTYLSANSVDFTTTNNVQVDAAVNNAVKLFNDNVHLNDRVNDSVDFEFTWDYNTNGNSFYVQTYIYVSDSNEWVGHEIHTYGLPPTIAADMSLFNTFNDSSLIAWNWTAGNTFAIPANFYKTSTNLPWGIEIITDEFWVPNEKTDIIDAYPEFSDWATSGGSTNPNWYNNPDPDSTFLPPTP